MSLSITVLGCSGSYAAPGSACSGYLVRSATTSLWVDCGPGSLANLQEHLALEDVDAILVSHVHPDHFGELPVAYNALKWYLGHDSMPVHTTAEVRRLTDIICGSTDDLFEWHVLDPAASFTVGDITVRCDVTDHPVETLAMRFDHAGRSIVYTADTGPAWDPMSLAHGADVMVCDSTVMSAEWNDMVPHLSAADAGDFATRCAVGRLVLTHAAPGSDVEAHLDEARTAAAGIDVVAARIGLVVELATDV